VIEEITFRPQPGPQTAFLESEADICLYGGAAGAGKTYALLLAPLRYIHLRDFGAVIFRRTTVEVRSEGGLWDESMKLYPLLGAVPNSGSLTWTFPSGASISFAHMEHEADRYNYQGAQIAFIAFDELTLFTQGQFWFMLSRNRSTCGIIPHIRATCNPDPDSFVASLISWWIDDATGYPIPERSGVLRWFCWSGDQIVQADSLDGLRSIVSDCAPMSLTFIGAKVENNPALLRANPGYLTALRNLPRVERERLLHGNWTVRASAGSYFRREWFRVDEVPPVAGDVVRYWDRAATEERQGTDPDWTVGVRLNKVAAGLYVVEDVCRLRGRPQQVEQAIVNTAQQDGPDVTVLLEQDPGQAGKAECSYLIRRLEGFSVRAIPVTGDKATRARPVSAQVEAGNVSLVRGRWNEDFMRELENFPVGSHDDQVDALSGAFNYLSGGARLLDPVAFARQPRAVAARNRSVFA
jgi:predicted phage terminase large subunit-like protein